MARLHKPGHVLASVLLLLFIIPETEAFPTGAPYKACANIYPKHSQTPPQTTPSPFQVLFSPASYNPGDQITVTLKGETTANKFKGFILRAQRTTGDTEELVGDFTPVSGGVKELAWYPQNENYTNCVTHSTPALKDQVKLTWTAPPVDSLGDVIFRATFVVDYKTFWVDVKSTVLGGNVSNAQPVVDSEVSQSFSDIQLDGACGNTKGCMYFPTFCSGSNCNYIVAYELLAGSQEMRFEIKAKATGYFTVALSADKKMGDDETVTCVNKDSFVSVQYGFNPAYFNDRHSIKGFRNISTTNKDGYIYCRFTRPVVRELTHIVQNSDGSVTKIIHKFDLKNPYYIFLAYGNIYPGADVLAKHTRLPLISKGKVDLTQNTIVRADSMSLEVKFHATLMILAWMMFALIASVTARYFKDGFNGAMLCNIKTWFHVHRLFALLSASFTIAAFILIFVKLKKWTSNASIHAGFGVAVTAIVLLQILGGMLRPNPNHPFRALFRNMHGLSGLLALLAAATALMLGVRNKLINEQLSLWMTIVVGVWMGLTVISFGIFEAVNSYKLKLKAKVAAFDESIEQKAGYISSKSELTLTTSDHTDELKMLQRILHINYGIFIFLLFAVSVVNIVFIFLF